MFIPRTVLPLWIQSLLPDDISCSTSYRSLSHQSVSNRQYLSRTTYRCRGSLEISYRSLSSLLLTFYRSELLSEFIYQPICRYVVVLSQLVKGVLLLRNKLWYDGSHLCDFQLVLSLPFSKCFPIIIIDIAVFSVVILTTGNSAFGGSDLFSPLVYSPIIGFITGNVGIIIHIKFSRSSGFAFKRVSILVLTVVYANIPSFLGILFIYSGRSSK